MSTKIEIKSFVVPCSRWVTGQVAQRRKYAGMHWDLWISGVLMGGWYWDGSRPSSVDGVGERLHKR